MKTTHVAIQLLPGHVDILKFDGDKCQASKRLPIDHDDDPAEWAKIVRRTATTIRTVVDEWKCSECPARVLYRSETQSIDLSGFAVRSAGQALEAAMLGAVDSLPYSAISAISEAAIVGRDASGDEKQIHVLVASEREDIAQAIVTMVEDAGLKFLSATPLDAAVMSSVVRDGLDQNGQTRATLFIGAHTSYFVVAGSGRLLFSRRIDLGLEALAASLTRPIIRGGGAEPIEMTIDAARRMLGEFGIPDRDQIVDEAMNLSGGQVIPLLQPVLQRFIVEIRQSIRFGLSEEDRNNLGMLVSGPGAAIPAMPGLLARELGIEIIEPATTVDTGDWLDASETGGELFHGLRDKRVLDRLNLMPHTLNETRRRGRLRRWALTGAAAAVIIVLSDGVRYHLQLSGAREDAQRYESQIEDLAALEETAETLQTVATAKSQLETKIQSETGRRVDYAACMQELSRITPPTIRFESMQFEREDGEAAGTIAGCAVASDTQSDAAELERFIDTLRNSPLFDGIVLRNVRTGALGTMEGQRFEATFKVVEVPRPAIGAATDQGGEQQG